MFFCVLVFFVVDFTLVLISYLHKLMCAAEACYMSQVCVVVASRRCCRCRCCCSIVVPKKFGSHCELGQTPGLLNVFVCVCECVCVGWKLLGHSPSQQHKIRDGLAHNKCSLCIGGQRSREGRCRGGVSWALCIHRSMDAFNGIGNGPTSADDDHATSTTLSLPLLLLVSNYVA